MLLDWKDKNVKYLSYVLSLTPYFTLLQSHTQIKLHSHYGDLNHLHCVATVMGGVPIESKHKKWKAHTISGSRHTILCVMPWRGPLTWKKSLIIFNQQRSIINLHTPRPSDTPSPGLLSFTPFQYFAAIVPHYMPPLIYISLPTSAEKNLICYGVTANKNINRPNAKVWILSRTPELSVDPVGFSALFE